MSRHRPLSAPNTPNTPSAPSDAVDDDTPSKTRRKNEMHALQDLGARLAELTPGQLAALDLPENLATAIIDYRRFTKWEAKRRQMQYIGRLMREVDPAPIAARLDAWQRTSRVAVAGFHDSERWRDRLLTDEHSLAEFCTAHPAADRARLTALVVEARGEKAAGRPPAAARRLFRELARLLNAEPSATPRE